MESSEYETRQSNETALPSIGRIRDTRHERNSQDSMLESKTQHRPTYPSNAVVTPTSPLTKYQSPLQAASSLAKMSQGEYISPPESRRTSEREDDPQNSLTAPSRNGDYPTLPGIGQFMESMGSNGITASIVSTGGSSSLGPLSGTQRSVPFPSARVPGPPSIMASKLPAPSLPHQAPSGSHQSSPIPSNASIPSAHLVGNHTPNQPFESDPNRDKESQSRSSLFNHADRVLSKDSPRVGSHSFDPKFSRPAPPPPLALAAGASVGFSIEPEHSSSHYESRPYGQMSPHISSFPPPSGSAQTPASSYSSIVPSTPAQPFSGQASAFHAYQQRNSTYNDDIGFTDSSYSPKGKATGKPSFQDNYGNAINRALDISELRRELDLIRDNASHLYHFSTQYTPQGGQQSGFQTLKYSGQIEPSIQAMDDAIAITHRILEALEYWRNKVVNDQARKQDQHIAAPKPALKRPLDYADDESMYGDDIKGGLGDSKKQRKGQKAAPPGRCHSCNRAETPEWRRGPDGARTLCNACGLHYAKLTRKLNKANTSLGPPSLVRKPASAVLM